MLVISHEFGHFIVAKKNNIRVDEFSFGFPPKLFGIKKGETAYNFNLLPLGGYVKIYGENPDEESINGKDKTRSIANKPWYVQAGVLVAGVVMNFLVAWLLLSICLMSGLPSSTSDIPAGSNIVNPELTITGVEKGTPADIAGLQTGDTISHLSNQNDSTDVVSIASLTYFIRNHPNDSITATVTDHGQTKEIKITPTQATPGADPTIGISIDMIGTLKFSPAQAVWRSLKLSGSLFVGTAVGFYTLIHDSILGHANISSLTGPIGIVGVVGDAAKFGLVYLLSFTALISINLAVINLIPFPALDGGRLLFLLIERLKAPVSIQKFQTL